MIERDKQIISDLQRFRVLNRDQIIQLHFKNNSSAINVCNRVMKRLTDRGYVTVDRNSRPFNYFPSPSTVKKDSTKIPHFLRIADFYIDLCKYHAPEHFEIEFKTGEKGSIEPDIFMIWKGSPFFVEIQRNVYSTKVMQGKMKRYREYYISRKWESLSKQFPLIWMLTDHNYKMDFSPLKVIQSRNVDKIIKQKRNEKEKELKWSIP